MRYVAVMCGVCVMLAAGGRANGELSPANRTAVEADWAKQEAVHGRTPGSAEAIDEAFTRGRALAGELRRVGASRQADAGLASLDSLARLRLAMAEKLLKAGAWEAFYNRVRWVVREMALANPALDFNEMLFVRRHWPSWAHQCSHRVGEAQVVGADLCVLTGLDGGGTVRSVLGKQLATGGIGRPNLSFDARRIVFPYAAPRPKATSYGYGKPGVRGGPCLMYDVYQIGVDGKGLAQLTDSPRTEDTEPAYLPDGRIVFTSTRDGRFVQCGDWALVFGIYTMAPDGSDVRKITEAQETEFYPVCLDDGRILYTRWDYVMKAYNVIQQLWVVNPDGTKAQMAYGDHYAFSVGPIAFQEARQIPGTSKVVCIGAAHHNSGVGPVMTLDLAQNRGGPGGMVRLTGEVSYPETAERYRKAGWYGSPWPLSENVFIVSYSFAKPHNARAGYGLYLIDAFGNKELIHRDATMSCYSPIPIRPRKTPRVIPDTVRGVDPATPGTLMIADVTQGLNGVKRGEARHLRILEVYPKTARTEPQRCDVGLSSGWDMRGVLGTVPIEADGSAHFQAPAGKMLFFEVLDKDYLEIRRMRNYMNVMPGEHVSCVGCHEPYSAAGKTPETGKLIAMKRKPSTIAPPPWRAGPMNFSRIVQPVLDAHCIACHDGAKGKDKSFDLRGGTLVTAPTVNDRDQGRQHAVSTSFVNLLKYVKYVTSGGHHGIKLPLAANAPVGSRQSPLMTVLAKGHYNVKLPIDQWRAMAAWIDCNAPYYGTWDDICFTSAPAAKRPRRANTPKPLAAATRIAIDRRRAHLARIAGEGHRLVNYVDCGTMTKDAPKTGPRLVQTAGSPWQFKAPPSVVPRFVTAITFHGSQIVFDASGLDPGKSYRVGLTWWDENTTERAGLVQVVGGGKTVTILPSRPLPSGLRKEKPETHILALPPATVARGACQLVIRKTGGANIVLSEIWLLES